MSFTLQLSSFTRKQLYRRLKEAYAIGSLKLVKRIHALLGLAQGQSVREVAEMLALGDQTVRDYRNQFLFKGVASLVYQSPPGRPSKLTKTQRQQLAEWIKASPQGPRFRVEPQVTRTAPPQTRTSAINAPGSSGHGFAAYTEWTTLIGGKR